MMPDIMAGIGMQMILMFAGGFVAGLVIGIGHATEKIVEKLKTADAEGRSLKDALDELTIESGVTK